MFKALLAKDPAIEESNLRTENELEKYLSRVFCIEGRSEVFERIEAALKSDGKWGIQVSHSDARILQFLLKLTRAKRVVEIGTLYGFSAYAMAAVMPKDGEIHTFDVSSVHQDRAKSLLEGTEEFGKIHFHLGDALEALPKLKPEGSLDFVFIDANKGAYLKYLDWAQLHLRVGGLVVADNTLLFGELIQPSDQRSESSRQQMREFNARLADSKTWNSVLLPTAEGLTVAQKL